MKREKDGQKRARVQGMYRRDLLKLAMAAGTGLLTADCGDGREAVVPPTGTPAVGPAKDQAHSPEDFSRMAYCGIECRTACPEHEYPDRCAGCKSNGTHLGHFCGLCAIRRCAGEKQVLTCAHCDEYPSCEVDTWTKYPILRDMIDRIRRDSRRKA